MTEVRFPNGAVVRATGIANRDTNGSWRTFGLYLDSRWQPSWPAEVVDWPDFGVPSSPEWAAESIRRAFDRALAGDRVEIGCLGGLGRTGTVLACMAILAGVPGNEAVAWVRANYDVRAVETRDQERWVAWFGFYTTRFDEQ